MSPARASVQVPVRWRDLDPLGHVNNAVLLSYLEIARLEVFRRHLDSGDSLSIDWVVARIEIDYRRPVLFGQSVEVECWPIKVGSTSFELAYLIRADELVVAQAKSVQVHLDEGKPADLPINIRTVFENHLNDSGD